MQKILPVSAFFLFLFVSYAQNTVIPDANFEIYLETHNASGSVVSVGDPSSMGDGISANNLVLTGRINTVTTLNVNNKAITSLTGIQDFTALTALNCGNNYNMAALDVTQNTALTDLRCNNNIIADLDVTQNTVLSILYCNYNQLTSLNISLNTNLTYLRCDTNAITSLDASNNSNLTFLNCSTNQLTSLNIKNGYNSNITNMTATNNVSLTCIQVDNVAQANSYLPPFTGAHFWYKPAGANFSENCSLGVEDNILKASVSIFPNPFSNVLNINSKIPIKKVEIYSVLGKKVKEINSNFNSISTDNLSSGLYLVKLYSENGSITKKVIKN